MVTLHVGPDKTLFQVHQDFLFDASPVFKAAFGGKFQEASERSMSLPDDDRDSVGRMISWLYTRKIELTVPVSNETCAECYMQLAELNTLADKYDIYLLKNRIVDELFGLAKGPRNIKPPQEPVIAYIYNNTTKGSSFRKLMVAWYTYGIDFQWYDRDIAGASLAAIPQDFAVDLALALGQRIQFPNRSNPLTLPASVFYETPPKKTDDKEASQTPQ